MRRTIAAALTALLLAGAGLRAQGSDLADTRRQAAALVKEDNFAAALPLLERIVAADPASAEWNFNLAYALASTAPASADAAAYTAARVRARTLFLKARELGYSDPMLDAYIESIPPDGGDRVHFSDKPEVDRLMSEGEKLFAAQKMDEALAAYQQALQLEPTLYEAALFSADAYLHKTDYAQAEAWYQKAIAINPARETAYRYSATPLMRQERYDDALARYVEAYITEPYNNQTVAALKNWAMTTRSALGHPQVTVPVAPVSCERPPCRTMATEAAGLRAAARAGAGIGDTPSSELDVIRKLDREELLEAYILLARADEGIARDHSAYLRDHRDKLRRYVMTYVVRRPPAQ